MKDVCTKVDFLEDKVILSGPYEDCHIALGQLSNLYYERDIEELIRNADMSYDRSFR